MLLDLQPLHLEDTLVDFEDFVRLSAELELSELESGLHEHKYRHFGFQGEPVPRQIVTIYRLL